jgi:hypothetical protein
MELAREWRVGKIKRVKCSETSTGNETMKCELRSERKANPQLAEAAHRPNSIFVLILQTQ